MDFRFDIDTKIKKSIAKKKKTGLPFNFSLSPRDDSSADADVASGSSSIATKTRRSGGWATETLKSAMRRSSSAFFDQGNTTEESLKGEDTDIPVIPNLDDFDDDEIAKAPLVGHKVSSFKELEIDLLKHAAFSSLEDVNLRVLTTFLQNDNALDEPDVPWTKESLFSDIITQLHNNEK